MTSRSDAAGAMQLPHGAALPLHRLNLDRSPCDEDRRGLPAGPGFARPSPGNRPRPEIGAQLGSFNFLNPLIWGVGSSPCVHFGAVATGRNPHGHLSLAALAIILLSRTRQRKFVQSEKILGRALTDAFENAEPRCRGEAEGGNPGYSIDRAHGHAVLAVRGRHHILARSIDQIGRASCRERVLRLV